MVLKNIKNGFKNKVLNFIKVTAISFICITLIIPSTLAVSAAEIELYPENTDQINIGVPAIVYKNGKSQNEIKDFIKENNIYSSSSNINTLNLPSSYSSIDEGIVLPPSSQKFNDCWAYAATSILETKLSKEKKDNTKLSELHLNYWATAELSKPGWQRNHFGGGYPFIPIGYFSSWSGSVPYKDFQDGSTYNDYLNYNKQHALNSINISSTGVTEIKYLEKENPENIKEYIYENGSVATTFSFNDNFYDFNNCSYYFSEKLTSANSNGHIVSLVGWDDNFSKENFSNRTEKPKKDGAWLAKNSWGNYNKLGGYFWLSYEDKSFLADIFGSGFTVSDYAETKDTKLYQNEVYGATHSMEFNESTPKATFINVFNFEKGFNTLDKIIFETNSKNTMYEIYYIPISKTTNKPDNNRDNWKKLYEDTTTFEGYVCANLEDTVLPLGKGGIGIKMYNKSNISIGLCEWLRVSSTKKYIFLNDSKHGDSYFTTGTDIVDIMDYLKAANNDDLGATFVIKAITKLSAKYGDADLDGDITIKDATLIQKHIAEIVSLKDAQITVSDFNNDNAINIKDASSIQWYLVS